MRFTVIYDSETGNTEKIANEIYETIESNEKELVNLKRNHEIPEADVYFIGFPIHQRNCGLKIIECLEQIETGKMVLFATCGLTPTEAYREKLEDKLSVWISDDVEYIGLFLCQGETTVNQQKRFIDTHPDISSELSKMLINGMGHPDENDLLQASQFTEQILRKIGA